MRYGNTYCILNSLYHVKEYLSNSSLPKIFPGANVELKKFFSIVQSNKVLFFFETVALSS